MAAKLTPVAPSIRLTRDHLEISDLACRNLAARVAAKSRSVKPSDGSGWPRESLARGSRAPLANRLRAALSLAYSRAMDGPYSPIPREPGHRWVNRRLFFDPTPNSYIQQRLMLKTSEFLQAGKWGDEAQPVVNFSRLLGLKILAVWLHLDRYQRRESELRAEALIKPIDKLGSDPVHFETAQDLYIELDEFLVQVKSALDYLARAPALVLGERVWNIGSFGDHGARVMRLLKSSTPASFRSRAEFLIHIIKQNTPWLESLISARDKVNHYKDGGIEPDLFTVCALKDGNSVTVRVPMWSDEQSVADVMQQSFRVLFHFVEQFFFAVLAARLPNDLGVLKMANPELYDPTSPIRIIGNADFEALRAKGGWSSPGEPL
jgi:hypothetical protein